MKYRLLAALLGLAMAGCTSQQQQPNLSYADVAAPSRPPALTATGPSSPQPAPSPSWSPPPDSSKARQATTTAGFPAPPDLQEKKCRTVGNVTTCDVPADPQADSRLYTN